MRSKIGTPLEGYSGRRGMRWPSSPSTSRPSASARTRVKPTNSRKNGMPMISDEQARGHREAGDRHREVEDAGDEREQHVEEGGPGARIAVDAEKAAECGARGLARRRRKRGAHLLSVVR